MQDPTIAQLMETRRFCYTIPADGYVEGHGWRPSVVFEDEPGHFPNGTWPYNGKPGETCPWFWGHDYETAKKIAAETNARMGLSAEDAMLIVLSTLPSAHARQARRRAEERMQRGETGRRRRAGGGR
jgi:hypothetical protein